MSSFQEFRFWLRRAPASERLGAMLATVIVVALLGWLVVPEGDDSSSESIVSGDTPSAGDADAGSNAGVTAEGSGDGVGSSVDGASAGGTTGGGSASVAGPTAGGSTPATQGGGTQAAATEGGCASPPGSAKGITDKEVKVAIVLTEIVGPAANSLFDVPTPDEAKADFDAAIAGINKEGGIACRKLVARYVNANPVDESQMMQLCREIADSDVFAVVDSGSLATKPAVLACFGQRKVPYFGAFYITESARQQFYPYIYSFYVKELLYKSTAFGLRDHGFYDPAKGFKKLGFIYRDCERDAINAFRGWIREAGVPDPQVVTYNVGCPAVFASEADLAQAVLTFQRAGVTHVTTGNLQGDIAAFTRQAERQRFRPKYGFPDEAMLSIATGSRAPDPDNVANALAITLSRDAENKTPGMTPTAGTQKCNEYRKAAGLPPVYDVPANAGNACSQLWMLQAAVGRAPELSVAALPAGLQRTKSIDFSFPQAPNDFTGNRVTTGGQFWRVAQFMPSCECWQVVEREFRRGF